MDSDPFPDLYNLYKKFGNFLENNKELNKSINYLYDLAAVNLDDIPDEIKNNPLEKGMFQRSVLEDLKSNIQIITAEIPSSKRKKLADNEGLIEKPSDMSAKDIEINENFLKENLKFTVEWFTKHPAVLNEFSKDFKRNIASKTIY